MSTYFRPYYLIFVALIQILHFFTNCAGQHIDAKVVIDPGSPHIAHISGRFTGPGGTSASRNLSFIRTYAGFSGLGERLRDVVLKDNSGRTVSYQTALAGEYVADVEFTDWSYSIDITPRKEQNAAAHVSWSTGGRGLF